MSVTAEVVTMSEPLKPLLDPAEMAEYLDISRATLDRWSKTPGFPVLRQGKVVKYNWRQVVAYLEDVARDGRTLNTHTQSSARKKRGK